MRRAQLGRTTVDGAGTMRGAARTLRLAQAVAVVVAALRFPSATAAPQELVLENQPFFFLSTSDWGRFGSSLERVTRSPKEITDVRCNGIDSTASRGSGAAYYWCIGVILGTPNPIGLSYGIQNWDTWSRYLAEQYQVPTRLFDCFTTTKDAVIDQYPVPFERVNECLDVTAHTDDEGRKFNTISSQLASREPLSTFVKIDIEGMEWTVLEAMSDEDFSKIALLDLEVHWCLTMQTDTPARVLAVLKRLLQQFAVVGRLAEGDWLTGVGCDQTVHQTTMMSVSYVNKAAMFGRIVLETTAVRVWGSVNLKACGGWHDRNLTSAAGQKFSLCSGYLANPQKWHRAEVLSGLALVTSSEGRKVAPHLLDTYGIVVAVLTCGSGTAGSAEICPTVATAETDVLTEVTNRLMAAPPLSVVMVLDLTGLESGLLLGLSDDALDRIHSLAVAFDFCSTAHSYQSIAKGLRRLQKRFLVIATDMAHGVKRRCGCLEGQQRYITVSYINKRGRNGKYNLYPMTPPL